MKEVIAGVKKAFEKMPPNKRRLAMLGIAFGTVAIVSSAAMLIGDQVVGDSKKGRPVVKSVEFYPLTGKDTSKLQGDVMSSRVKQLEAELDKLKSGEFVPGQQPKQVSNGVQPGAPTAPGNEDLFGNQTLGQAIGGGGDILPGQVFAPGIVPPPVRKKNEQNDSSIKAVAPGVNDSPLFPSPTDNGSDGRSAGKQNRELPASTDISIGDGDLSQPVARKFAIREIVEDVEKKAAEKGGLPGAFSNANGNIQEQGLFMPAGSIISGVLITGLDAPTANQSKKDPFPALLRVKDETLLPNRMKMDIRECFIIASGYGDMSSERAYMRAESLSCVREDGGVIETPLNAYSVGEDGKNGIRGRLVSKTGQLVAKSLMAGFLGGIADVMKPQKVPTLNLDGGDKTQFMSIDPGAAFGQGALGGINNSMTRIADYYIEMARSIFPIIEIEPGRKVDFIVLRGAKLAIQSGSKGNQQQGSGRPNQQRNNK